MEVYPSGMRFAGDECLGDRVGSAMLALCEREHNELRRRLDAAAAALANDTTNTAAAYACVRHVAAWVGREVLPRAQAGLQAAQAASAAQDARFQRVNAAAAGDQQRAALVQGGVQCPQAGQQRGSKVNRWADVGACESDGVG